MYRIPKADYKNYISWAAGNTSNRVYPLSIAEGIQAGDIFADDFADGLAGTRAVLFRHYCGFGYITGEDPSEAFLSEIYGMMNSGSRGMPSENGGRRLILITDSEAVIRYFRGKDVEMGLRVEYRYPYEAEAEGVMETEGVTEAEGVTEVERVMDPEMENWHFSQMQNVTTFDTDRFRIERINSNNIVGIRGRIIPSFSWESGGQFLEKGFGYVAVERDEICAVAFSAAVSSREVDIGVETREEYRGNGLAAALAAAMCGEIFATGLKPVWAHAAGNIGSMKTALRCGFVEDRVNTVIRPLIRK